MPMREVYACSDKRQQDLAIVRLEDIKYVLLEVFGEYPLLKEQIRGIADYVC